MINKVFCQQFNVNDDSYKIVELGVTSGSKVKKGDIVLSLESSKAIIDVEAEFSGFYYNILEIGEIVFVGDLLYLISEENIDENKITKELEKVKVKEPKESKTSLEVNPNSNKIITEKALELINKHNIEISNIAADVITEDVIKKYLNPSDFNNLINITSNFKKKKKIAFIGAGQGLIQVLDLVNEIGNYIPVCVYDDTESKIGQSVYGVEIRDRVNYDLIRKDFENNLFDSIVITVSTSIDFRKMVFKHLTEFNIPFENLIHPSVTLGFDLSIGQGNLIFSHSSIGPCTIIGSNNFISSHCNIEHHNIMGSHNTFGPGVMTSGNVEIGNQTKFGTGIFIEPKIKIGDNCTISSGSIIVQNINDSVLVFSGVTNKLKSK